MEYLGNCIEAAMTCEVPCFLVLANTELERILLIGARRALRSTCRVARRMTHWREGVSAMPTSSQRNERNLIRRAGLHKIRKAQIRLAR